MTEPLTTQTVSTAAIDRSAWEMQHDLLWGRHEWPAGTKLAFCRQAAGGHFAPLQQQSDVNDHAAGWAIIEPFAKRGDSIYVTVAPRKPDTSFVTAGGKPTYGGKPTVLAHSALVADLDTADGAKHSSENLPTRAQALAWIAALPVEPTLVVDTGGGFHVYVALSEPVDLLTDGADFYAGWDKFWTDLADRDGVHIDQTPLVNVAGVLKVAGTRNHKSGLPVRIISQSGWTITPGEARDYFPAPSAGVSTARPTTSPSGALPAARDGSRPAVPAPEGDDRPGARFAREHGADQLLIDAYDARKIGVDGLTLPLDGQYPEGAKIRIYAFDDDGVTKVTFMSDTLLALWGLQPGNSLNSFDIVAQHHFARDYRAAAKAIVRANGDYQTIVGLLRGDPSSAATVQQAAPTPYEQDGDPYDRQSATWGDQVGTEPTPHDLEVLASLNTAEAFEDHRSLTEMIESRNGDQIQLDDGIHVVIGGPEHGLWQDPNPHDVVPTPRRVTTWVARVSAVREVQVLDREGEAHRSDVEKTYAAEIIPRVGRVYRTTSDIPAAIAFNSARLTVELEESGVGTPVKLEAGRMVGSMLQQLGARSRERMLSFSAMGWYRDQLSGYVFLAPAGSVTASGVSNRYLITADPLSKDARGLAPAARAIGWDRVLQTSEEIREAAQSVQAFFAISPENPGLPTALLGMVFTAPLPQSSGTSVIVVGQTGQGKSLATSCAQGFFSGMGMNGSNFMASFTGGTSQAGLSARAAHARFLPLTVDDYKQVAGEPKASELAREVLTTLVQRAFGADEAGKAQQTGDARATRDIRCHAIVSAEQAPTDLAIINRSVIVRVSATDVLRSPVGSSPLDIYAIDWLNTGQARALFGTYLQWLAGRMNAHPNGLNGFEAEVEKVKKSWATHRSERAALVGGVIWVGWSFFREFLEFHDAADALQSVEFLSENILALVDENVAIASEAKPARLIVEAIRNSIAARDGHVVNTSMMAPTYAELLFGWDGSGFDGTPRASGKVLGVVSDDLKYVVLTSDAVQRTARSLGFAMSKEKLAQEFAGLVVPGSTPGERTPMPLKAGGKRGYAFPLYEIIDVPEAGEGSEWRIVAKPAIVPEPALDFD